MRRQQIFSTASPAQTKAVGRDFAKQFSKGLIAALSGTLGSGKTTFVQGMAEGRRIGRKITSPTFIRMARYPIARTSGWFYHFDLYRLRRISELAELGFSEILFDKKNVIIIEWPEKIRKLLPKRTKWIKFTYDRSNPKIRNIKIA